MKKILNLSLSILLLVVSGCKPIGELVSDVLASSGSIVINEGALNTNSTSVSLTFDSSDSTEMYVTNTEGCESGGTWEAFATKKSWTLGQTNATATVYVRFKDPSQNLSICYSDTIVHDDIAPIALNVTSNKPNGSYTVGEAINIQVIFSESVEVTGTPRLQLATGQTTYATYVSGSGTSTLTFSYTVASGDTSSDLNYSSTSALTLDGGTIVDMATNAADLTLPGVTLPGSLADNTAIVIDTSAPTVTNVTSDKANGIYTVGEVINIQVGFSETVVVSGIPRIQLATGQTTYATYASGSGTDTLTFSYTVASGNASSDLNYSSTSALTLNGGTIRDIATNAANLDLPDLALPSSLAGNKEIVIDAIAPTLTLSSSTANPTNSNIVVTATFSESVTGFESGDITVGNGTAGTVSGSGSNYSFTVTPTAQGTVSISVATTKAQDAAGNNNTASNTLTYTFDTTAPTVTLSSLTANPTNSTISVTATFSESVTVLGTASVSNGTAGSITGSGTSFSFTVTPSHDGYVAISLPAGAAKDAAGNDSVASSELSRAYVFNTCGASGNGCYDHTAATASTYATLQDGNETTSSPTFIEYKKADSSCAGSCFYVWQDRSSTKILNSSGLWQSPGEASGGWQKRLNPSGIGYSGDLVESTEIAQIGGRVCPYKTTGAGVFIDYTNMTQTGRCLYYDKGNAEQSLDAVCPEPTDRWGNCTNPLVPNEASDWLQRWDRAATGRGTSGSYYEGNIKTCNLKGMRLPTMYETSMATPDSSFLGLDGLSSNPIFAGSNGVPHYSTGSSTRSWTASAYKPDPGGAFWQWVSGEYAEADLYGNLSGVRCVLP